MEVCNEKKEINFVWINIRIGEEMGYFRNKLNRIPKNINELKRKSSNWVLLRVDSFTYYMCPTGFSGNGLYNLKFMSKYGRNEGVYINIYGDNNNNSNKGLACTENTDPKNMGTYNFSGMYYKDGLISKSGFKHWKLDIDPYERYGNKSRDDLPKDDEKSVQNGDRYKDDLDAKQARATFEKSWQGIKE